MTDNDQPEVQTSAVVKVARDLTEIERMATQLSDEGEHRANSRIDGSVMPGGLATIALAPVANLEAWEHRYQTAERMGTDTSWVDDEDDSWEPPLQTLCFWSEQWRASFAAEYGTRPTIGSEANFIRWALPWAWDNLAEWDDFASDIRRARVRLENVLYAGNRAERSRVSCIETECERKPRLIKIYRDDAAFDHYRCPACKATYTPQRFHFAKAELLASQDADRHVPMQDALAAIDRSERTFRKWLRFWYVRSYRDPLTGTTMVWWPDVREADLVTQRRTVA